MILRPSKVIWCISLLYAFGCWRVAADGALELELYLELEQNRDFGGQFSGLCEELADR